MSATDTPAVGPVDDHRQLVADPELDGQAGQLDAGPERRDVRRDRDQDPVGPLEDDPVDRPVRRVHVDDDEVVAACARTTAPHRPGPGRGCRCRAAGWSGPRPRARWHGGSPARPASAARCRRPCRPPTRRRPSGPGRARASWRCGRSPCPRRPAGRFLPRRTWSVVARFIEIVVLPTPPFGLNTATIVARFSPGRCRRPVPPTMIGPLPSSTVWARISIASTRQRSESAEYGRVKYSSLIVAFVAVPAEPLEVRAVRPPSARGCRGRSHGAASSTRATGRSRSRRRGRPARSRAASRAGPRALRGTRPGRPRSRRPRAPERPGRRSSARAARARRSGVPSGTDRSGRGRI